tara:strand:+ start:556 stop:849 length:294 start_codon:yes stop_codon:yes gene_type:complete
MPETLIELLMNGSPMVAFAGYLLWSNHRSEKKLDDQHVQFMDKLDQLEDKHAAIQEKTRERWMAVVDKLENEKNSAIGSLAAQHDQILLMLNVIKKD